VVDGKPVGRYGGIVWRESADIDDAIRVVRTFRDPDDAARLIARMCRRGERWAVVDLAAKQVIAGSKEVVRA
jgi:hypothetical protein